MNFYRISLKSLVQGKLYLPLIAILDFFLCMLAIHRAFKTSGIAMGIL